MSDEDMDRIVWCRVVMTLVDVMAFFFFYVKGVFVSWFGCGLHLRTELLWTFEPSSSNLHKCADCDWGTSTAALSIVGQVLLGAQSRFC